MFDKAYYDGRKEKLTKKFQSVKDNALQEIVNINNRLVADINEINQEIGEIDKLEKDNNMSEEIQAEAEAPVEAAPEVAVEAPADSAE